jgi:GNAT superfamily N-acetyltransferase
MISIRRARPRDINALAALWKGLMSHHTKLYGRDARAVNLKLRKDAESIWRRYALRQMRSSNGLVLIVEDDGVPVGYSLNIIKPNIPIFRIRKLGHIGDLYLKPGYRGKGIGTRLRGTVFRWFRKKGIKHTSIAVHPINSVSCSIYRKWGFSDYHLEMRRRL